MSINTIRGKKPSHSCHGEYGPLLVLTVHSSASYPLSSPVLTAPPFQVCFSSFFSNDILPLNLLLLPYLVLHFCLSLVPFFLLHALPFSLSPAIFPSCHSGFPTGSRQQTTFNAWWQTDWAAPTYKRDTALSHRRTRKQHLH